MRSFKNVSPFGDLNVATGGAASSFVKFGDVFETDDEVLADSLAASADFEEVTAAPAAKPPATKSPATDADSTATPDKEN